MFLVILGLFEIFVVVILIFVVEEYGVGLGLVDGFCFRVF